MGTTEIIVIEPEAQHKKMLLEALKIVTPDSVVFSYSSITEFFGDYKKVVQSKGAKDEESEQEVFALSHVGLIIADLKETEKIDQALWQKLITDINRRHDEGSSKARFLYTSFDQGERASDPRSYLSDLVFNVLLKPFDQMIVQQTLALALADPGPLKLEGLYSHDQSATIELIKHIEIDRLTELGFRTKSKRPIEVGKIARYRGKPFEVGSYDSVFAYCYSNTEVSKDPKEFASSFSYIGVANEQLRAIRRLIQADKNKEDYEFPEDKSSPRQCNILVFSNNKDFQSEAKSILESKFSNVNVQTVASIYELVQMIPPHKRGELEEHPLKLFSENSKKWQLIFDENFHQLLEIKDLSEDNPATPSEQALEQIRSINLPKVMGPPEKYRTSSFLDITLGESNSQVIVSKVENTLHGEHGTIWALTLEEPTPEQGYRHYLENHDGITTVDAVVLNHSEVGEVSLGRIKNYVSQMSENHKPKYIKYAKEPVDSYFKAQQAGIYDDVLELPLDVFIFTRKLKMHLPQITFLKPENNMRSGVKLEAGIKTALPVDISSISEVHVSFEYYREMRLNEMRRLVLYTPNDKNMPEIPAVCKFSEKTDQGTYRCDFMFFAVGDSQLKYIRQWIKENYVQGKAGEGEG